MQCWHVLGIEITPLANWSSELSKDLTQGHRVKQQGGKSVSHSVMSENLCSPMDCRPPDSSVLEILLTRILEWVTISSSRGSSRSRDWTLVSCIAGRFFTVWATRVGGNAVGWAQAAKPRIPDPRRSKFLTEGGFTEIGPRPGHQLRAGFLAADSLLPSAGSASWG